MGLFDLFKKPETKTPTTQESKGKVLVVDDEQVLKEFYEDLLTRQGYQVFTAGNGQEALQVAQQQLPDVILLDIMMPIMDGFEVLKQLNVNEQTKNIPVIVLTNAGNIDNMDKAKTYAVYRFFVKANVAPEELLSSITEAIQTGKSPQLKTTL